MKKMLVSVCMLLLAAGVLAADESIYREFGYDYESFYLVSLFDEPVTILVNNPEGRDHSAFLGNPQEKTQAIRQLLLDAASQIKQIRDELDTAIDQIVINERRINSSSVAREQQELAAANLLLFERIENIRLRIARVQMDTAQRVYDLERNAHKQINDDVNVRMQQIQRSPSQYWLWRRNHLLQHELKGTLSEEQIRQLYRR